MRLLVCGGRAYGRCLLAPHQPGYEAAVQTAYREREFLTAALDRVHERHGPVVRLGHGAALGADTLAGLWAEGHKIGVSHYRAQWERYGDSAGIKRNIAMLAAFRPDLVVAFPGGTGTAHMASIATAKGVEVIWCRP